MPTKIFRYSIITLSIIVGLVAFVVLVNAAGNDILNQKRSLQLNRFSLSGPNDLSAPRVSALVTIEDIDPVRGEANAHLDLSFDVGNNLIPPTQTEISATEVTITAADLDDLPITSGPIVGETDLFTLERKDPVSNIFSGTTELTWQFSDKSSPSSRFPFDTYYLPFSTMYLVPFGVSKTIYPIDLLNIRIGNSNLITTSSTQQMPEEQSSEVLLRIVRPWPMKVLFIGYVFFALFYLVFLARLGTIKNWPAALIGLTALFGAREILTRGVDLYPNLVDYALLVVFILTGYIVVFKTVSTDTKQEKLPHH